ncbi:histone-lysine N-methyltransferase SETD1B [Anopheles nili]|uniref:histone-lysine N-methyltransferase SETD1B n=1 Tax=Anopheles nili TaxID=185578 RepID=UPI00237BE9A3|nr:histone-lysine N-methyltransferase SETD1B [Anopheles nili]
MPIQKKKVKKPKENETAKPSVNIKQEPEELKPLSAYIDDRLELLRQVFSCVKPKEIKYLLPDFLEGKSNDLMKERCLDELLGISTKRLHSIITNTKCPTDTESSSENSDVEKIEEHISLDEISSESDVDGKRGIKRNKKGDTIKQPDEQNGEPKSEKEMTVLELLELQARARAIRSQLALEPVTKIEIDSEHEGEDGRHGDIDTDDETKLPTRKRSSSKLSTSTSEFPKNGNQLKHENNGQQNTTRVRLKRNFRIRKVGDDDDDDQEVSSNPPDSVHEKPTERQVVEVVDLATTVSVSAALEEKPVANEKASDSENKSQKLESEPEATATTATGVESVETIPVEEDANAPDASVDLDVSNVPEASDADAPAKDLERESSPEVIPVEASPETLCISSDSEEERLAKERASIFVPNIEELDRQANKPPTPVPDKPAEDTEPEEGEISEEEEVPVPAEPTAAVENEQTVKDGSNVAEELATNEGAQGNATIGNDGDSTEPAKRDETVEGDTLEKAQSSEIHTLSSSSESSESASDSSSSESSSDEEEEEPKSEPPKLDNSAHDDEDIVEIHDSGDENLLMDDKPPEEEAKSWNSRWLKSNRVAKVMAASRLGNKVREKLKKKKQIQLAEQQESAAMDTAEAAAHSSPKPAEPVVELPTNVELGSVEHYRELVAQQESKD